MSEAGDEFEDFDWPAFCPACDLRGDELVQCEGCDCCSTCCNCSPSDCDCDECVARRELEDPDD